MPADTNAMTLDPPATAGEIVEALKDVLVDAGDGIAAAMDHELIPVCDALVGLVEDDVNSRAANLVACVNTVPNPSVTVAWHALIAGKVREQRLVTDYWRSKETR